MNYKCKGNLLLDSVLTQNIISLKPKGVEGGTGTFYIMETNPINLMQQFKGKAKFS